jgi:hypothetical protein
MILVPRFAYLEKALLHSIFQDNDIRQKVLFGNTHPQKPKVTEAIGPLRVDGSEILNIRTPSKWVCNGV